jgi:hypothetical protein
MSWNLVSALAIAPRRRVVASTIVYGLSLAVRFTSATGEEVEIPPQAVQSLSPMTSIMVSDGTQLFNSWPPKPAHLVGSSRWVLGSRGCDAACQSPMATPSCSSPP